MQEKNKLEILHFGSLLLNDEPVDPGAIYGTQATPKLSIVPTVPGKEIPWLRRGSRLIALQNVIYGVSWVDLFANGFTYGISTDIAIDGRQYQCRLPRLGRYAKQPNEWEEFFRGLGTNIQRTVENGFSWGMELIEPGKASMRCGSSLNSWTASPRSNQTSSFGFRPVLEPVLPPLEDIPIGFKLQIDGNDGYSRICGALMHISEYDIILSTEGFQFDGDDPMCKEVSPEVVVVDRSKITHITAL